MRFVPDILQGDATRWTAGFVLAAIVGLMAFRTRSLSASGAVAAVAAGGLLVGAGGWWSGLLLVAFFVTSSALSRAWPRPVDTGVGVRQARGHRRDAVQVLANGGVPVACALLGLPATDPALWLVASASAIAGATADTWATEIGRASSSPPRSIVSGKRLAPGTSGAISVIGTCGSVAGAVLIAALAAAGTSAGVWVDAPTAVVFAVVAIAGVAGGVLDSVLGATLQGIWWCPACGVETESPRHQCGSATRLVRGVAIMTNDLVNALALAGAAAVGMLLMSFLQ